MAPHYAETQIRDRIDDGWTATGTRHHYRATTHFAPNGKSMEIAFCVDSSKFYGKETKTEKIRKTEPSIGDFDYFKIIMVRFPTRDDLW